MKTLTLSIALVLCSCAHSPTKDSSLEGDLSSALLMHVVSNCCLAENELSKNYNCVNDAKLIMYSLSGNHIHKPEEVCTLLE